MEGTKVVPDGSEVGDVDGDSLPGVGTLEVGVTLEGIDDAPLGTLEGASLGCDVVAIHQFRPHSNIANAWSSGRGLNGTKPSKEKMAWGRIQWRRLAGLSIRI